MIKSTQTKIILIIILLAVLMFGSFGVYSIMRLQNIIGQEGLLVQEIFNLKIILGITVTAFLIISLVIIIFTKRIIEKPILRLIQSAKEIDNKTGLNSKNDIDELTNAFDVVNTGLKENINEVIRQKKQMETILRYMNDGIIAFNMKGKIIHINPAARNLLNIAEKEKTFEEIFSKLDEEINMEKLIYLDDWTNKEKRLTIEDKHLKLFFAPYKDENERPSGIIVLIQDITEHVKLDNMRKEFIADVSHELKTPLTSIMGYAETLANSEYDTEMQEKFLKVITSEAVRMTKLVSDLLTLSKFDNAETKWEKVEFNLGDLVKSCQENLQIEIDKKNQKVECFVTANVPTVCADKDGIERVILNILSNSIKYTEEGGTIKIYVGFVYNDAYIKIIDNGIGIPEKDLERIFERFYRVDKARTRKMGGTGLGLSIAKEILDRNNGRIDIKSEVGKGTEVVITIPTVLKTET